MSKIEYKDKALEGAAIHVAAAAVPQSLAVNSLVTSKLASWMSGRIDAGLDCNIYAELERLQDAARVAIIEKENAVRERDDCQMRATKNEKRAVDYSNQLTAAEAQIARLAGRVGRRDHLILELKAEVYDIRETMFNLVKATMGDAAEMDANDFIATMLKKLSGEGDAKK